MNEFTKEELLDLNIILCVWISKYNEDIKTKELQLKTQSMILYKEKQEECDHIFSDGSGTQVFCSKCNLFFGKR